MKKLISAMVIMGMSACVLAKENAYWEYTKKLSSGDTCYYLKNSETDKPFLALGNAAPESVYNECTKNGSYERAVKNMKKYLQYQERPQDNNYNRGLDLYNACIAGAEMNTDTYFRILRKYKGKDILIIGKAYDYGRINARKYRDCTNYLMGR